MTQKQGVMHGRDHQYGGADPAGIAWQSVGGGAGVGGSWAYAWQFVGSVAPSTVFAFSLTNFYTNDPASFASAAASGYQGISVLQPGMYRLSFAVILSRGGEATPASKQAQLQRGAGGSFFTVSDYQFGNPEPTGVPYPALGGGGGAWRCFVQELWDYETAGGTYPAPAVTVSARHNAGGACTGDASMVIERLGAEIVGGIN